jgi:hypothetical protein
MSNEQKYEVMVLMPETVAVKLRGNERTVDVTKLHPETLTFLLDKGIQRGANDPLGALFKKGEEIDQKKLDDYFTDLTDRWERGEVEKRRTGGLGRTTDPVMREMKRLANDEITKNIAKLLAAHGVTRTEFDSTYRVKYLKKRLADHADRLREEAVEYLARLKEKGEEDEVEILDFDADESEDEPEDESEEEEEEEEDEDEPQGV